MASIGIDASRANTARPTGTEWYSFHLLRALSRHARGDELYLYAKESLIAGLTNLGPHVHERILSWPPQRLWTHTRLAWEMLRRPPDLLFVPAHTIPIVHPARTVTTAHDIGFDRFPELYTRSECAYHQWSMRYAVRHAKHIITPSAFTRQELLDAYSVDPERVSVIHHGFDPHQFRMITDTPKLEATIRKYRLTKPYILYVGRLERKKNIFGLVQAFAQLRAQYRGPLFLVLAGSEGFQFERVREYIAAHHLDGMIRCTGYIPADDLPLLLNQAALFAFPSLYEGFGLPILEAQACGTPVVTSSVASMPEVAGKGAVLVDPHSPEAIADGLLRVLENPALAGSLKAAGLKNLHRFRWEICADQTLTLLHKVLDGVA